MYTIKNDDVDEIVRVNLSRFKDNDVIFRIGEDNKYPMLVITYGDLFKMINQYKTTKQMALYIARICKDYFKKYVKRDSINFYMYILSSITDKINEDILSINIIKDDAWMLGAAISCHDNIAKCKYVKRRLIKTFGEEEENELISFFKNKPKNLKYYDRYDENVENKLDEIIIAITESMRNLYNDECKKLTEIKEKLLEIIKCYECFEIEVNVKIGCYNKNEFTTDTVYKGLLTKEWIKTSKMHYVYPIIHDKNRKLVIYSMPFKRKPVAFFHSKKPIDFKDTEKLFISIS